jgi:hypothetical protein
MSESGRVSRILTNIRQCEIQASILKARAIKSRIPCSGCVNVVQAIPDVETPIESIALATNVEKCFTGVIGRIIGPESTRIINLQQKVLDQSNNEFDPATRFVQYRGLLIPPVCPPTSSALKNASLPKASTKSCGLGNKFYLPTLPI